MAELKDNINTMISNLRETTERNREQDWLKTNLAKFTGMLQGQRELNTVGQMLLTRAGAAGATPSRARSTTSAAPSDERPQLAAALQLRARQRRGLPRRIALGEGLVGQCAVEKKRILLTDVPPDFISDRLQPRRRRGSVEHRRAAGAVRRRRPRP